MRVRAMVADALWPAEPDGARGMLTTAFDDATALRQDLAKRRSLRSEIIRVAARRDRDMVKQDGLQLLGEPVVGNTSADED